MIKTDLTRIILNEDDIKAALEEKFGPGVERVELHHRDDGTWGGESFSATITINKEV